MPEDRRHIAVMFSDIVGYTAMMASDEDKTFQILKLNREIHIRFINQYNGTLIKEMGDGMLISFQLASEAVRCAIEIRNACLEQNIPLKIGIHEGEMIFAGDDLYGNAINIASRIQEASREGRISISEKVCEDIRNKSGIHTKYIGEKKLKNVPEPVKVYEVLTGLKDVKIELHQIKNKKNKLHLFIILGLFITLIAVLIWKFIPGSKQGHTQSEIPKDKSIAVLPFRNDSPDQENEYFCNGMLEEILTHLQKIEDLNVKSRTSSEQYRNVVKDLQVIASELKVAYLLEGSVRKDGDNIRITAQLIDGISGDHLWAETYDRKYTTQLFEFQSNVAKKIAASLNVVITPEELKRIEGKKTNEIIAYDLVLKGWDEVQKFFDYRDTTYVESAFALFNKAYEIDPEYEEAICAKGHLYVQLGYFDSALYYGEKVLALDSENANAYHLMARYYYEIGNTDLAIEYWMKTLDLVPNHMWANYMLGYIYLNQKNDVVRGFTYMNKALKQGAGEYGTFNLFGYIGMAFAYIGDYEKAEEYLLNSLTLHAGCDWLTIYVVTLLNSGRTSKCLQFLDSICSESNCDRNCIRDKLLANFCNRDYASAERDFKQYHQAGFSLRTSDSLFLAYIYNKTDRRETASCMISDIQKSLERQLSNNDNWGIYALLFQTYAMKDENIEAMKYLNLLVKKGSVFSMWPDYLSVIPISEKYVHYPEFQSILFRIQTERAAVRAQVDAMRASGEIDL